MILEITAAAESGRNRSQEETIRHYHGRDYKAQWLDRALDIPGTAADPNTHVVNIMEMDHGANLSIHSQILS